MRYWSLLLNAARPGMALGLVLTLTARAEGPASSAPSHPVSLSDCIELTLARNFDLRIERENTVSAWGQLESASAAYVPTVSLTTQAQRTENPPGATTTADTRVNTSALTTSLSGLLSTGATYTVSADLSGTSVQPITGSSYDYASGTLGVIAISQPLLKNRAIDSTRLTLRQRKLDVRIAESALLAQAMTVVSNVEKAYCDLIAARETVKVDEQALALAAETLAETRTKRQIGTLTALDEKSAQAQVASSEVDLISARQTVREKQNALLVLLTDDYAAQRGTELVPGDALGDAPVALDYAAIVQRALANRPELEQLALTLDQKKFSTRYQADQRLPQLDVSASYGLQGSNSGLNGVTRQFCDRDYPYYGVGLALSLPWTNRKGRGDLQSAQSAERQTALSLALERQAILAEVDNAFSAVQASFDKIAATRQAREYAAAALAAEREKLTAGTTTTYSVLQMQRDLTTARGNEITALASYNKALSTLRLREAATLDYWHIAFDRVRTSADHPATSASHS